MTPDLSLLQWAAQHGPFALVSAVLLYFMRRDNKDRQAQADMVIAVLKESTAAHTANTEVTRSTAQLVQSLHRRVDRWETEDTRAARKAEAV